ncbi:MAG: hypothetical protein ACREAA_07060 [Candidatus Polarisedimenticolia bacterium]
MLRLRFLPSLLAACFLVGLSPAIGVENGAPDGTGHPAVGFILGTLGDPCTGGQFIGFNGVLIAPDLLLTTGNIALETQLHIDENFFDTAWVILDPEPLVSPTAPVVFDCSKFVRVVEIIVNPFYLNDPDRNEGDVGLLRLETPQAAQVADLPVFNRLKHMPRNPAPALSYVAFGRIQDPSRPSGFDLTTIKRRSATAATVKPVKGEVHNVELAPATTGGFDPCITNVSSGGPAFIGVTNEIVSLAIFPPTGCHVALPFQRLDVNSVRNFLAGYVTLP